MSLLAAGPTHLSNIVNPRGGSTNLGAPCDELDDDTAVRRLVTWAKFTDRHSNLSSSSYS